MGSDEARKRDVFTALQRLLGDERVLALERRPAKRWTSFALEELDVTLAGGGTLQLLLKELGRGALDERAVAAKPDFLSDPLREIEVYESLLAPARLGTPKLYGAVVDPAVDRYWLFIERVQGVELRDVGDLAIWKDAARWLANMHHRMVAARSPRLIRYDADFYRLWLKRARTIAGDPTLEAIAPSYERVVGRLLSLPQGLLHGEYYAMNVLVRDGDERRISPVDWEMAGLGPGLVDLAALTSGSWSDEERTEISLAYLEALPERPTEWDFLESLDCCRLHVALQWLGWSPNWSPPPEHRNDWLAEARQAGERLGLI